MQYALARAQLTVFSWVVAELKLQPAVDVFVLARYVHPLGEFLGLFLQVEALATIVTQMAQPLSFTERARVGIQVHRFQLGPGLDVTQAGRGTFTSTLNVGGFARVEF